MKRINYKSDFDFVLRMSNADGTLIGWPEWDWKLVIYTKGNQNATFTARCVNGECENCFYDEGLIHIVCDSHGLGTGVLYGEFYADVPNPIYSDGKRLTVTPFPLGLTLVSGQGDDPTTAEIEASIAMAMRYVMPWEIAAQNGWEGTADEYIDALVSLPSLVKELRELQSSLGGTVGGIKNNIINLNASDRDTTYTLETAIAALDNVSYGSYLLYVNTSGDWDMWQFTGRDFANAEDWSPVGVVLSESTLWIDSEGNISDLGLDASPSTRWAIS